MYKTKYYIGEDVKEIEAMFDVELAVDFFIPLKINFKPDAGALLENEQTKGKRWEILEVCSETKEGWVVIAALEEV